MPHEPMTSKQALDRFHDLVQSDQLGIRFNKENDDIIWHYTSVSGFSGILGGSCIWASDYRYMNDVTEFSFGLEIFEMTTAHRETTPFIDESLRAEVLEQISILKDDLNYLHVLTASFCSKGNVLSQWRAYARQDGIAIGFSKPYLTRMAREQDFRIGRVHYYWSDRDKELPEDRRFSYWSKQTYERLRILLEDAENARRKIIEASDHVTDSLIYSMEISRGNVIRHWLAETVPFIKHPAFAEEQEWRIVKVFQGSLFRTNIPVKHRPSGSGIVPYIDFDIKVSENSDKIIKQIVLGPNSDRRAIRASVSFLISKYGLINLGVSAPFHPLNPLRT